MASSPAAPPAFALGEREFVFMLASLQALQALAIDSMLPALGEISRDLGVLDPNRRQLVVAVFLLGISIGALLPGALADRYGRRPVLFTCLAFYIVPGIGCALVTDFDALLALRFIQAAGSGGLAVIPPAIIRDRFEGDRMARLQSMIAVIFMVVPMLAPTLGQGIMHLLGWRWIFALMGGLGALVTAWAFLRLPETLDPANRQEIRPLVIARNMGQVFVTRGAIGYVIASGVLMSTTWGFVNLSQQLIAEHFGAGDSFPLVFGCMALCMATASFTNSRIVERFGARRVGHTAVFFFIAAALVQLWFATRPHQTIYEFVPLMAMNMSLVGFMGANFTSIALQPFARTAGAAASVQSFLRTMLAAVLGAWVGQAYDGTARPLAVALVLAGLLALALVLFSERGVLFRRVHPRGSPRPTL